MSVRELTLEGKSLPKGIYTSSTGWLQGSGYVVVGDVKRVVVSGVIDDPNHTIGAGNIAVLKSASTFKLPDGDCSVAATGDFPLTLVSGGSKAGFGGFITGNVALRIEATGGSSFGDFGFTQQLLQGHNGTCTWRVEAEQTGQCHRHSGQSGDGRLGSGEQSRCSHMGRPMGRLPHPQS